MIEITIKSSSVTDEGLTLSDLRAVARVEIRDMTNANPSDFSEQGIGDIWTIAVNLPGLREILEILRESIKTRIDNAINPPIVAKSNSKIEFKCGDVSLSVETNDFADIESLFNRVETLCKDRAREDGK